MLIRRYELLIGSAIVIICVALLSIFLLKSNFVQAAKISSEKKVLAEKLSVLKEKDNRLSSLDSAFYQSAFTKMNKILPEEKDYVSLFYAFDNLEKETGVVILRTEFQIGVISTSSARLTKAGGGIPAYAVPLSVMVEGNASSIENFISRLSNLASRFIDVESVKQTKSLDGGSLQALINGRAFFYPLPSTIGKIDSPLPKLEVAQNEILQKIAEIVPSQGEILTGAEEAEKIEVGKKNPFQ